MRPVEPAIYVYKLVADNGGAPCVWRGILSLALCKPKIRKSADVRALIFGFGGKEYGERLIYIAEVTEKPPKGAYYRLPRFAARPDCIYEEDATGMATRKADARYHADSDERTKDVGRHFERADVVLSREFRYFGKKGTIEYKEQSDFREVKRLIEGLKRGHRVNHSAVLREQLLKLKKVMWRRYLQSKIGPPTDSDEKKLCNTNTPSTCCS